MVEALESDDDQALLALTGQEAKPSEMSWLNWLLITRQKLMKDTHFVRVSGECGTTIGFYMHQR